MILSDVCRVCLVVTVTLIYNSCNETHGFLGNIVTLAHKIDKSNLPIVLPAPLGTLLNLNAVMLITAWRQKLLTLSKFN